MAIYQLLPVIAYGDAIGNDTLALSQVIKSMGYKTGIYAEVIDQRLPRGLVKDYRRLPKLKDSDVVIYHLSTGSELNYFFGNLKCKKVVIYHNITPKKFFRDYNMGYVESMESGMKSIKWLADKVDYCLAVSEFNKKDLIELGYKCRIDVLPIVIPYKDYEKEPSDKIIKKYRDGITNILFTGRVVPNKCQQDVIKAFAYYQKHFNPNSRLIMVGTYVGFESYKNRLSKYVEVLDVKNVIFTGHIKFNEILAYYRVADLFLCQSEHEGFCVPLVEAMYFDVPIVAYDSTAIGDTMSGGGILLKEKNPIETAAVMDYVINNKEVRETISGNQKERLKDFDYDAVSELFKKLISNVL